MNAADDHPSNFPPLLHYKWFNSYNVPVDVQIGVSRLELPLDMKVTSQADVPEHVYITASLISNDITVSTADLGTHYATIDGYRNALVWDYVLTFPIKIQNLSADATIAFTAWTPAAVGDSAGATVYGGTSLHLFDTRTGVSPSFSHPTPNARTHCLLQ
jgi:hypothetical protein